MSLRHLFRKYSLDEVFTPSTIAKLTYVQRLTLENDVDKFLRIPGMQIVLYGHSGCGKSTLIYNKLNSHDIKYINTSCISSTTFNDLLYQAFDKLNSFYVAEKTSTNKITISNEIKAKYAAISSALSQTVTEENSAKSVRVLPVQITPERLAEFLGAANCVWVIEDFHKVIGAEKKKIADVLKIFMDTAKDYMRLKIICIGAVGTARELIELDSNLSTRVAEIYVPLLSEAELVTIINKGFRLMNVTYKNEIRDKIVYYSNNLASICHQLCYDICFEHNITKSKVFKYCIKSNDFNRSVVSYVRKNSDTLNKIFDNISTKETLKYIIKAIIKSQQESLTIDELHAEVKKIKNIEKEDIETAVNALLLPEFNEVLRFDITSRKFTFSSPFFHAFAKMKLALEQAEKAERRKKRKKRKGFALEGSEETFFINEKLFEDISKSVEDLYRERLEILHKRLKKTGSTPITFENISKKDN